MKRLSSSTTKDTLPATNDYFFHPPFKPPALLTNFDSPEADHDTVSTALTNLSLAGMYHLWNRPAVHPKELYHLIKETTALVKHYRALYNLPYGNKCNSIGPNARHSIVPID